ncbi:MAG TPA: 3-hydroxyacyl-CoA dehydrogenase NAD-binding domain-containing protein [Steroidobacteraceae bacterium]
MSVTGYARHGDVAVITMDNPPVNGLSQALRHGVLAGMQRAQDDSQVRAIVIVGSANGFSGGADIREFGTCLAAAEPTLRTLIRELDDCEKPVIAAIGTIAMGGGLELALGCHYRLAAHGARIAFPEVKLGLLPGAGGTQRLPRLIGLKLALAMIVSGRTVAADELARTRLFDRVVAGDLLTAARAFAAEIAPARPLPRARDLNVEPVSDAKFAEMAAHCDSAPVADLPAPQACIEALHAALGDFDEGLVLERKLFTRLMQSPESAALRYAFFAERAAAKIPDLPATTPVREIRTAGVIGGGTMGRGIAMAFANAGIEVKILDTSEAALRDGFASVSSIYAGAVQKGKLSAEEKSARTARISGTLAAEDLARADIVVEAVFEDLDVKRQVFETLDRVAKPGAILATNTSTLNVDRIANFTARPADVVGTHFFSPAHVMRLLEIVRGAATSKEVLASVLQLAKRLNKVAVVAGVCEGFIGNRMLRPYLRQAELLLLEGCLPHEVDAAVERWGMAMGPFRVSDLAGTDVSGLIRKRQYLEQPERPRSLIADRLVELGRFGQKSGKGYYLYPAGGREAVSDTDVERLILELAKSAGLVRRAISATEIVERLIFALVNEGAKILAEGIALRASDIDVVYLTGYGFPARRGGPMFYADTIGLNTVLAAMHGFAANPASDPGSWTPAALLVTLAAAGKALTR